MLPCGDHNEGRRRPWWWRRSGAFWGEASWDHPRGNEDGEVVRESAKYRHAFRIGTSCLFGTIPEGESPKSSRHSQAGLTVLLAVASRRHWRPVLFGRPAP